MVASHTQSVAIGVCFLGMFGLWGPVSMYGILEGYFLQNRIIFDSVDKLSPVSNMAYSCLKKC